MSHGHYAIRKLILPYYNTRLMWGVGYFDLLGYQLEHRYPDRARTVEYLYRQYGYLDRKSLYELEAFLESDAEYIREYVESSAFSERVVAYGKVTVHGRCIAVTLYMSGYEKHHL